MRPLNSVIQPLVRAVLSVRHLMANRFDRAAQLVRDHDAWLPEALDQRLQEPSGRLRIPTRLYEDIKDVTFAIHRAPKPVLHAVDWDHDFIEMPLVSRCRSIPTDAIREMGPEPVNPKPDRLTRHNDPTFGQQIFNICCAQCEAVVRPDGVGHDLSGKAEAFQAWHRSGNFHPGSLSQNSRLINLAGPAEVHCAAVCLPTKKRPPSPDESCLN